MRIRTIQSHELSPLVRIYTETIKAIFTGPAWEQVLQTETEERTLHRLTDIFNHKEHHPFGYVCTDQGTILGFAVGDVAPSPPEGYQGELKMIYVLPAYHRMGVGRKLLLAVAEHFEREKVASLFLGVFTNNSGARRFYEALGGRPIDEFPGEEGKASFVRYGWPSVQELIQVLRSSSRTQERLLPD